MKLLFGVFAATLIVVAVLHAVHVVVGVHQRPDTFDEDVVAAAAHVDAGAGTAAALGDREAAHHRSRQGEDGQQGEESAQLPSSHSDSFPWPPVTTSVRLARSIAGHGEPCLPGTGGFPLGVTPHRARPVVGLATDGNRAPRGLQRDT